MSKTIYKYPLSVDRPNHLPIPPEGKVLSLQLQRGEPCIWVELNPNHPIMSERVFLFVGTGHSVPVSSEFIDTLQFDGGSLVFHLYELPT